jgi:hypothetical protein
MGGGSGGGGTTVTYQQPSDPYGDALKQYQLEQLKSADAKAAAAEAAKEKKAAEKLAIATEAFDPFKSTLKTQLASGLINYGEAKSQLEDYITKYELGPKPGALEELGTYYSKEIQPKQLKSQITAAYKQYTGAAPTEAELAEAQTGFTDNVYKSISDLKDVLKESDYYQEKFNKSYLDNYYDTMYGKPKKKDEAGNKVYDFKFNKSLMPTYAGDLAAETGVSLPEYQESFSGTAGEIQENIDAIKDTKKYIYSAGLTNLQGNIDKETQKLKNEGAKEVAKLQKEGGIYTSLIGAFNF